MCSTNKNLDGEIALNLEGFIDKIISFTDRGYLHRESSQSLLQGNKRGRTVTHVL